MGEVLSCGFHFPSFLLRLPQINAWELSHLKRFFYAIMRADQARVMVRVDLKSASAMSTLFVFAAGENELSRLEGEHSKQTGVPTVRLPTHVARVMGRREVRT
jgi:hypothetical protein